MSRAEMKRTKITELLQYIEDRLHELEEEKEELKEFQEKDKERRCLEYALYWREVEDVAEALDKVPHRREWFIIGLIGHPAGRRPKARYGFRQRATARIYEARETDGGGWYDAPDVLV